MFRAAQWPKGVGARDLSTKIHGVSYYIAIRLGYILDIHIVLGD